MKPPGIRRFPVARRIVDCWKKRAANIAPVGTKAPGRLFARIESLGEHAVMNAALIVFSAPKRSAGIFLPFCQKVLAIVANLYYYPRDVAS